MKTIRGSSNAMSYLQECRYRNQAVMVLRAGASAIDYLLFVRSKIMLSQPILQKHVPGNRQNRHIRSLCGLVSLDQLGTKGYEAS